jgi:hypothetical protein
MANAELILTFSFLVKALSTKDNDENRGWLLATIIMAIMALTMFFIQHFITQVFDLAVEVSVFYIPAMLLITICLKRYLSKPSN